MNNAKVSVCIAVYNVEKYIEQCACSLFEQTFPSIEYIFVDFNKHYESVRRTEQRLFSPFENSIYESQIMLTDLNQDHKANFQD